MANQASDILNKLLEYLKLNPKQFADSIGLARPQAIYDIQKNKTSSVSVRMALKICSIYPQINYLRQEIEKIKKALLLININI